MNLLRTESEASECQARFVECCEKTSTGRPSDHTVQFNPRTVTHLTYFFDDFWVMPTSGKLPDKVRNRYWNAMGLGSDALTASNSIAIEVNYPHKPTRVGTGGKFLSNGDDHYLGHNGLLGGGLRDGRAHNFIRRFSTQYDKVQINDRDIFVIAKLEPAADFVQAMRKFVFDMSIARSASI